MSILDFAILSLATRRIASLLVYEDGPWEILGKFRCWVGVTYDEHSRPCAASVLGKLFQCSFCVSLWVGLALMTAFTLWPSPTRWITTVFALSAIAIIGERQE